MIPFWWLYPAAVDGAIIGMVVFALCAIAKDADRYLEKGD